MIIQKLLRRLFKEDSSFISPLAMVPSAGWFRVPGRRRSSQSSTPVVEDPPEAGTAILTAPPVTGEVNGKEESSMEPTSQSSDPVMTTGDELDDDLVREVFGRIKSPKEAPGDEESPDEASSPPAGGLKPEGDDACSDDDVIFQAGTTPEPVADDNATAGIESPHVGGGHTPSQMVGPLMMDDEEHVSGDPDILVRPQKSRPRDTSPRRERELASRAARQRQAAEVAPEPLVRTMVEILPKKALEEEEGLNLLPEGLDEIFQHKESSDPRVKMLLMDLEPVDLKELERDLADFAKSIGAVSDQS